MAADNELFDEEEWNMGQSGSGFDGLDSLGFLNTGRPPGEVVGTTGTLFDSLIVDDQQRLKLESSSFEKDGAPGSSFDRMLDGASFDRLLPSGASSSFERAMAGGSSSSFERAASSSFERMRGGQSSSFEKLLAAPPSGFDQVLQPASSIFENDPTAAPPFTKYQGEPPELNTSPRSHTLDQSQNQTQPLVQSGTDNGPSNHFPQQPASQFQQFPPEPQIQNLQQMPPVSSQDQLQYHQQQLLRLQQEQQMQQQQQQMKQQQIQQQQQMQQMQQMQQQQQQLQLQQQQQQMQQIPPMKQQPQFPQQSQFQQQQQQQYQQQYRQQFKPEPATPPMGSASPFGEPPTPNQPLTPHDDYAIQQPPHARLRTASGQGRAIKSEGSSGSQRSHAVASTPATPQLLQFPMSAEVEEVLHNVERMVSSIPLSHISNRQYQVFKEWTNPPSASLLDSCKTIQAEQDMHLANLVEAKKGVERCINEVIVAPIQMHNIMRLLKQINKLNAQFNLLRSELQRKRDEARSGATCPPEPSIKLFVQEEPFPFVFPQKYQLPAEELQVEVLKTQSTCIEKLGRVSVILVADARQIAEAEKDPLGGDVQEVDYQTNVARFPLTFNYGTRKETVRLRFSMPCLYRPNDYRSNPVQTTIESEMSLPFVVMTNQKQWENCAGTLLRDVAFQDKCEIPWARLGNALQDQFLAATRQKRDSITRTLSCYDLSYISARFFGSRPSVSPKEFEKFWQWYGKCLQVLRYQRHICQLWLRGLVYGLMTRHDVHAALTDQKPGTFVIRFSESHAGLFGLAYISQDTPPRLKHYLVKPTDTAAAKITLPDFLKDKSQFSRILMLVPHESGKPHFEIRPKDTAFSQFYSNRDDTVSGDGYEPLG